MTMLPVTNQLGHRVSTSSISIGKNVQRALQVEVHRKKVVNIILLAVTGFQLISLPGAIMMKSAISIGTVLLGLVICLFALIFNQLGKVTIVTILLICVVDLGCGLMLLTTPMGLGVMDLPVFDVLVLSELIAVSLLAPSSVFVVALSNIAFIIADLLLQPKTAELQMMLSSNMGFNAVMQPISLQVVVAVVSYIWVRSAMLALARADRAEEIAEMQKREAERQQHLEDGIEHLSQVLVQASNGDRTVRAQMNQSNLLWRVGNSLNLLLTRLLKVAQLEQENKRLRAELSRVTEARHIERMKVRMQPYPEGESQSRWSSR